MSVAITHIKTLEAKTIHVREHEYPVSVDGTGDRVALSIGIGSHMQMTLSQRIKEELTIFSSDLYWTEDYRRTDIESLSIDDFVDDIITTVRQLQLDKPFLIGFSCYGILALEAAKKLKGEISGVILVSSPPAWGDETIARAAKYFDETATLERKENDKKRRAHFAKIRKENESIVSVNAYEADAARYWKDYHVTRVFLEEIWQGIHADDGIMNHFFTTILPNHKLQQNIDEIAVPVILLAGELDFDSIPLLLWKNFPKPVNFTVANCGQTGHWPNLEAPEDFDKHLLDWLSQ